MPNLFAADAMKSLVTATCERERVPPGGGGDDSKIAGAGDNATASRACALTRTLQFHV